MCASSMAVFVAAMLLLVAATPVHAEDNGLAQLPFLGWNTWSTDDIAGLLDLCFEKEILEVADAMAKYLKPLGYQYIILDDCWAAHERDELGKLQADPKRFPNGLKPVIDHAHSLGLRFGAYTCAGTKTCKYNRPGSYGYYHEDAQTFADWGLDLVKLDNCHIPSGSNRVELYSNFSRALNETGRPMVFSLCEWGQGDPWKWAPQIANSWRIHEDTMPWWWGNQGTLAVIESAAGLSQYAGPGGWNMLDIMQILVFENQWIDSKTCFSFWALVNSPLVTGSDIRDLGWNEPKAQIIMNSDVIAVNQDPLAKAGDRIVKYEDNTQVWAKDLADGSKAIILFNPHDLEEKRVAVQWSQLGLPANSTMDLYNLWTHKEMGRHPAGFSELVWPHDVVMMRATPVEEPSSST